jgi:hypothetical protein
MATSENAEKERGMSPFHDSQPLMAPPSYEQSMAPTPVIVVPPQGHMMVQPGKTAPGVVYIAPQEIPQNEAPDHLLMAILTTIFCCMPLGVVAIFKAAGRHYGLK